MKKNIIIAFLSIIFAGFVNFGFGMEQKTSEQIESIKKSYLSRKESALSYEKNNPNIAIEHYTDALILLKKAVKLAKELHTYIDSSLSESELNKLDNLRFNEYKQNKYKVKDALNLIKQEIDGYEKLLEKILNSKYPMSYDLLISEIGRIINYIKKFSSKKENKKLVTPLLVKVIDYLQKARELTSDKVIEEMIDEQTKKYTRMYIVLH